MNICVYASSIFEFPSRRRFTFFRRIRRGAQDFLPSARALINTQTKYVSRYTQDVGDSLTRAAKDDEDAAMCLERYVCECCLRNTEPRRVFGGQFLFLVLL